MTNSSGQPTLFDVIKIIPPDCHDNPTAKGMFYVVRDFAMYVAIVTVLFFTDTWWLLIPLWILSGLIVSGLFVLGHDASHGALFSSKKLNRKVSRLAMLPSAHIEAAWDLGHNRIHHGHTVKQGMDFVWHPITVEEWTAMSRLQQLRHKMEWSSIGAGFYYGRQVWWNKMMRFTASEKWAPKINRDRIEMIRILSVISLALIGLGYVRYGSIGGGLWIWVKIALIPWALFIWTIGFTVYVHHIGEHLRWYPQREWTKFHGQMEGTTVLHTNRLLNIFFHNIFVHVPHHVDMQIPFYKLPQATEAIKKAFPNVISEDRLSFRAYLRTTKKCKLYNFEEGRWLTLPSSR